MKNQFNRFALRFLFAVLAGLVLLLLHGPVQGGPLAGFVPQRPSAWELSKLAFWPMLLSCLATGRIGKERRPLSRDLPAIVLTPLLMTVLAWALLSLEGGGRLCLLAWVALLAAGLGLGPDGRGKRETLWAALAALLAVGFVLLTYLPLPWGPFLAPG